MLTVCCSAKMCSRPSLLEKDKKDKNRISRNGATGIFGPLILGRLSYMKNQKYNCLKTKPRKHSESQKMKAMEKLVSVG